ncbi:TRAP-type C4-dicarboxylate transport system, small permease component [Pseudooceanicola antarcticus]|uniref:TRAP transporter small permease protein n=1 Tax=Pseudooceanicola antarcticus TaxID=1247613 RepID=A0A285IIM3_9RHOB|nr:TRAP transporter small permease subunit [Pseudooceanicola antarcticus]PJE28906.1 TRAP transporter small permease [Pseudooceanicola antarcticus]SNY47753.1 TRAP-type C4-dicarboxylate transport system, small permease component [Pseudooceanicola antarcticus]
MAQPDDIPTMAIPDAVEIPPRTLPEAGRLGWLMEKVSAVFAIGIILAMAILVLEVVSRYFFGAPTTWAHETSTFLSAITFIFGGLLCVVRNSHIRVVLLYDLFRGRALKALNAVISLVCTISTGFFAWAAWRTVEKAIFRPSGDFYLETSGSAWNSPAPALIKIFLFLVLIVMSLQFLILAFNYMRAARGGMR